MILNVNLGPGRCNTFPSLTVHKKGSQVRNIIYSMSIHNVHSNKKVFHTWILYLWQIESSTGTKCKDIGSKTQATRRNCSFDRHIFASFLTSTFFLLNSIIWLSLFIYSYTSLSDIQCSLSGRSISCWLCLSPMLNKMGEIITNGSGSNCEKRLWQQSTRFNLHMVYKNILPLEL
jgi:hypothetical protein